MIYKEDAMSETINAKGLACPQPVILTKKSLESHDDVVVLVDNAIAVENIKRLATGSACSCDVTSESDGTFAVHLIKQGGTASAGTGQETCSCDTFAAPTASGPTVFVIASDTMGKGNDELGAVLMRAFIHTALDLDTHPEVIIFYNAGVKLACEGSDVLDDLRALEEKGIRLLVCGTCVNYFNLTEKVKAGVVSNMYDIAGTLSRAGRIVQP